MPPAEGDPPPEAVVDVTPAFWPFVRAAAASCRDDTWLATCPWYRTLCDAVRLERPLAVDGRTFGDVSELFDPSTAALLRPGDARALLDLRLCLRLIERSVGASGLAEGVNGLSVGVEPPTAPLPMRPPSSWCAHTQGLKPSPR